MRLQVRTQLSGGVYITANDTVSASQAVSTFGRVLTRNSLFPRWRAHTSTQVGYRMWLHCELGVYIKTNDGTWHVHTAQHRSSIDGCDEQLAAETSFPRTRQTRHRHGSAHPHTRRHDTTGESSVPPTDRHHRPCQNLYYYYSVCCFPPAKGYAPQLCSPSHMGSAYME